MTRAIFGKGDRDSHFIVHTLRLPRAITGVLVGAAFGLAGAILQTVVRNPLASPDIIGITSGASMVAVLVIVVYRGSHVAVAIGALCGGLSAAMAVFALAFRRGLSPHRMVLIGIGVGAALSAVTSYAIARADIYDVQRAMVWLTGSLNGRSWHHATLIAASMTILSPLLLMLRRDLGALQLGDDSARALGLRVESARVLAVALAVAFASIATATAGPVALVAFLSPAIARRILGAPMALAGSAIVGALLVLASDLVARRLFAPHELPVGLVTGVIGTPYLLWLLATSNAAGRLG